MDFGPLAALATLGVGLFFATRDAKKPAAAPAGAPAAPAGALQVPPPDPQFFSVDGGGVVSFLPFVAAKIREMLVQFAIVPVDGNPYVVELVQLPANPAGVATALQWHDAMVQIRPILGVRWMFVPAQTKRFLRAVSPGEELQYASAAGAYAVLSPKASGAQAAPSAPGFSAPPGASFVATPANAAPDVYSELPGELAAEARALATSGKDADKMDQVATELARQKYTASADALRTRARELRAKNTLADIRTGRRFTIRANDNASALAQYYTNNAGRWKEIVNANPGMQVITIKGITQIRPWNVGDTITLPESWDTSKPLPPKMSGGTGRKGRALDALNLDAVEQ